MCLAVAAVLTGCQGTGSEPTTLSAPAPSAATTPPPPAAPPSSTPAASPTASSLSRDDAALATAVGYYEAVERAYRTLDVSEVKALSSPDCQPCRQQVDLVEKAARAGHRFDPVPLVIEKKRVLRGGTRDRGSVRLDYRYRGFNEYDSAGRVVRKVPAAAESAQVDVAWHEDHWVVHDVLGLRES